MNWKIAAVLAALLVGVGGVGAAFFVGAGPFGGDGEGRVTETPSSTGTVYTFAEGGGGNGASQDGTVTGTAGETQLPPFYFEVVKIEKCGRTCRDVTVRLINNQNQTANEVTVYTRIYAGNSTKKEDKIWEGKSQIGTMQPGATVTRTQRVKLSFSEALAVKNHDGWITIVTTVASEDVTITFKQRRDVA